MILLSDEYRYFQTPNPRLHGVSGLGAARDEWGEPEVLLSRRLNETGASLSDAARIRLDPRNSLDQLEKVERVKPDGRDRQPSIGSSRCCDGDGA